MHQGIYKFYKPEGLDKLLMLHYDVYPNNWRNLTKPVKL